ncbi:uncharacterized protein A4U43_C03F2840 [Asparagus officinalis]|uniref:Uncharacterized protein n=1 Tax=Asparagus officinalis TaxID=4686 RepID=A0A5P1F9L1_ASPOF|nr:uncharacterized protein A4U43_C03F2840 [Asparagus officinalis]
MSVRRGPSWYFNTCQRCWDGKAKLFSACLRTGTGRRRRRRRAKDVRRAKLVFAAMASGTGAGDQSGNDLVTRRTMGPRLVGRRGHPVVGLDLTPPVYRWPASWRRGRSSGAMN